MITDIDSLKRLRERDILTEIEEKLIQMQKNSTYKTERNSKSEYERIIDEIFDDGYSNNN